MNYEITCLNIYVVEFGRC